MSLLEQAIIDAQELKEAALKSAESSILEKYSADIREAVDSMLEQEEEEEEDPMAAMMTGAPVEDPMMGGMPEEEALPEEKIPYAADAEIKLCPCPDDDEEITVSFDQLQAMAGEMGADEGEQVPEEDLAMAMGAEEGEEEIPMMESIDLDELLESCGEMMAMDPVEHPMEHSMEHESEEDEGKTVIINLEEIDTSNNPAAEMPAPLRDIASEMGATTADMNKPVTGMDTDEPIELEDIDVNQLEEMIREAVKVDVFEDASEDWPGQTMATKKEDADKHGAELTQNTTDEDVSIEEEVFAMRTGLQEAKKAIRARDAQIKDLKEKLQILAESSAKLKQTFMLVREQFEETNLSNAKLLYTNRTLKSTSLNERQKNRIAESIQSADTIEEAKVIFETLQSTVGESRKSTPKSLNEAIKRPSLTMSRRRRENSPRDSLVKDRFQALAGIKK